MRTLYHFTLCPYSRKVRIAMGEKKLDFELELEKVWEKRQEFLSLNPAGQVPVLIELNGSIIADSMAIMEYLDEAYPDRPLMGRTLQEKAEVRRLVNWFDDKFAKEIWTNLVFEKVLKRHFAIQKPELYGTSAGPNSHALRIGRAAIHQHLLYISWLVDRRKWLAGDEFSAADIAAAAHLSTVDYIGDIPWAEYELAKDWYARVKSRPSFRPLLADRAPGLKPADHYEDLDF